MADRVGDHPRLRGEHFLWGNRFRGGTGPSPPTRGARRGRHPQGRPNRTIPAYAGSTTAETPNRQCRQDHPRLRGEHHVCLGVTGSPGGPSPPTRGARRTRPAVFRLDRTIPAYAGSTKTNGSRWYVLEDHPRLRGEHTRRGVPARWWADHPRLRGEHLFVYSLVMRGLGPSPPTRGALRISSLSLFIGGTIPAYAGST